ncbi:virulence RhuM family protein [Bifidobacterium pullorum]|nr:RhuM family protein [Bifidobacterium pullorum]
MSNMTGSSGTGDRQVALYESHDHTVHLDVHVDDDTVWLTAQQLATLFGRDVTTVRRHIRNAESEELQGIPVSAKFVRTASDGKTYQVEHYNLDMILSVGYRVKSREGVYFRRWANNVLKQHLVQGYTVNRKRLETMGSIVRVLRRSSEPEISGAAEIIDAYLPSLGLLNAYDEGKVNEPRGDAPSWTLTYMDAMAFIHFLARNGILRGENGQRVVEGNALTAMTLMIALSDPKEKDMMTAMVEHFIS